MGEDDSERGWLYFKTTIGDYDERERNFFSGEPDQLLDDSSYRSVQSSSDLRKDFNESVRRLNTVLAPQVQELDNLMDDSLFGTSISRRGKSTTERAKIYGENPTIDCKDENQSDNDNDNENDNHDGNHRNEISDVDYAEMEQELEKLSTGTDQLRRELDTPKEFASFFAFLPMYTWNLRWYVDKAEF